MVFNTEKLEAAIVEGAVSGIMGTLNPSEIVREKLREIIDQQLRNTINNKVDALLAEAMTETLNDAFYPVNSWGEKIGEPTTLRAVIHERARNFWNTKVNKDGNATTYAGQPRWEKIMGDEVYKAFIEVMRGSMDEIAESLKAAVRKDFIKAVDANTPKIQGDA